MALLSEQSLQPVWPGPQSRYLVNSIVKFIEKNYPTNENSFMIARNLEEDLRGLLCQNKGMVKIDNVLYYLGEVTDFSIELLIRSGDEEVFPNLLINSYDLPNLSNEGTEELFGIIVSTIEYHLNSKIITDIDEKWNTKIYRLTTKSTMVLVEDFDKNRLGIFLYLLYLRDLFQNNPEVCVVISDIAPLIKKQQQIEKDLGNVDRAAFITMYPHYKDRYDNLRTIYTTESTVLFRFVILSLLLVDSGPYLQVVRDADSANYATLRNSRSFEILMNRCENSGRRFTISFLIMSDYGNAHANIIIVDRKEKTIERYEPNGYVDARVSFGRARRDLFGDIAEKADDYLHSLAREKGYKFSPPSYFCPRSGAQQIELDFEGGAGYCVTWSLLYGIERIESGLSKEDIATNFIDILIKRYALGGATNKEKAVSIEQLLVMKVAAIFDSMDAIYKELSTALGVKVKYEQGKLVYFG